MSTFACRYNVERDGSVMCDCGCLLPMQAERGRMLGAKTTYLWYRCRGCGGITKEFPLPVVTR